MFQINGAYSIEENFVEPQENAQTHLDEVQSAEEIQAEFDKIQSQLEGAKEEEANPFDTAVQEENQELQAQETAQEQVQTKEPKAVQETQAQETQEEPKEEKRPLLAGEYYIKEIEILGNNLVEVNFLKSQMELKEGYIYNKKEIGKDLNNIYKTGYFTQKIKALPIKIDNENLKLRIIVEENPPVTGITITGAEVVPEYEVHSIMNEIVGHPQNIELLNASIARVQELYATRGYILARVVDVYDDPDGVVNITIDEGKIEDVVIDGLSKTKDYVVARNVMMRPGTVYNENIARADIARLLGTQAFGDVQRDIALNPETGQYVVTVNVEEQRTGRISLGVGIDSASGFFGSVGFGENNFRGLGQKLNLNVMAGTGILMSDDSVIDEPNIQAELSFLEPHFKNKNNALGVRAYIRHFGSYQVPLAIEQKIGAEVNLAHRFVAYKNLSGSISFGVENVKMKEGDEAGIRYLYNLHRIPWVHRESQLDDGFYVKLTPGLTYDTRDNKTNARRGVYANVTLEEAINVSGFHNSYGKLTGGIKKFIPAGRKSSVVLSARGGGKINGNMPEFAAYSLGGPYSLRGFNISEVGTGKGFMTGSVEFRTPIPFIDRLTTNSFLNNIRLAAFVDAGKVFGGTLSNTLYDKPEYAISAGVGLRVFIPGIGPISLDYGVPFTNTSGIDRKKGFFTFGMGDMY
ncbi:BamA/TamA family outer membrane protein [bacterium]|nr:BamA/TamA family outer membrane protein [bacterium]